MNIDVEIIVAGISLVAGLIIGWQTHRYSIILKNRQQKEEHYQKFISALIYQKRNKDEDAVNYSVCRNTMLTFASTDVINKLQEYENKGMVEEIETHNSYLTELIKAIRKDLKVSNKNLPILGFKFFTGWSEPPEPNHTS